jgi:methyl-accepting chemotaxis protein
VTTSDWTFGKKLGAAFALTSILSLLGGIGAIYALRDVVESKDRIISFTGQDLADVQRLAVSSARKSSSIRGFLLSRQERQIALVRERRALFLEVMPRMRARAPDAETLRLLAQAERLEAEHEASSQRLLALRRTEMPMDKILQIFDEDVQPKMDALARTIDTFTERAERKLEAETAATNARASAAIAWIASAYGVLMLLSITASIVLARTLGRQIGTAVGHVQSSSAELQSAANQQATASKEQATAMSEISTTITELLVTSRQIAESAQRVAQIASQTAGSASSAENVVERAHESILAIRRQVDLIVGHMLELGRKSQQIGSVLDIVAELAEQTNILAINATIESVGAGESGKRFGVVADEIRKLADRVAGSTKEIRNLIEDVRSSVNTTVMTTETGSKAVDSGARQFSDVTTALKQITGMVATTTDAAKEIELSTKQQSTAVEQVNVAITNVAQATKETEASSGQILQTAGQLNGLSSDLLRLVQPQARVHLPHAAE